MLEGKRKDFCRPSTNIHHKSTTTQDDPIGTGMDNGVFDDNRSHVKQFSCHERHQGNDRTKVQRVSRQTRSESDFVHFPQINDTEVLTCECSSRSCQTVFWFPTLHNNLDFQFLLSLNNAGRTNHEASVDKHRFQASKRDGGSKMTFTLRLINISSEDAGLYTCMLQNQKENELWRPGVLLRPGAVTEPPTKQRGNGQQQQRPESQDSWTWEEILDGKGPWAQAGEYCRPKAELEAANWGGGTQGVWRSQPLQHPKQHPKRPLHQKQLSNLKRLCLQGSLAVGWSAAGPGCGSKVLWPLVGVLLALAVALIFTLYYFSRKDQWSNSEHPDCRLRDSAVFTVCVLTGISFHFMNLKTVLLASYFSILCSLQRRNRLKFQLSKRKHLGFCSQC